MSERTIGWQGEIWLGSDHCLLVSTLGTTDSHVHYAHQVLVALDGEVEVQLGDQYHSGALVMIPSQQPHAIISQGVPCLTLSARELANTAALSISQLERLFSGALKLSVRRLVLWQRLRVALRLALSGVSLTDAALAAGFADSAHFARSVRRQFGLSPSTALRQLRLRTLA